MPKEKHIIKDPRFDDQATEAFTRAERTRDHFGHDLIIPETLVMAIIIDPSTHPFINPQIPNQSLLERYIKDIPASRHTPKDSEYDIWDQYVEWAINQSVIKRKQVRIPDLFDYLYLTDPMMDFRFALTNATPVNVTVVNSPKSNRRRYLS